MTLEAQAAAVAAVAVTPAMSEAVEVIAGTGAVAAAAAAAVHNHNPTAGSTYPGAGANTAGQAPGPSHTLAPEVAPVQQPLAPGVHILGLAVLEEQPYP